MECPTTPEGKPSGLGSFRFARHYSGNRVCFLFVEVLSCFSSLGVPYIPYVFRNIYVSITKRGLPHSEILGYNVCLRLPEAYRCWSRPSSAPSARAFTVRPCSLNPLFPLIPCISVLLLMSSRLLLFSLQGTNSGA